MSNEGKKRSGIGNFWDAVAPPAEEVRSARADVPAPAPVPEVPTNNAVDRSTQEESEAQAMSAQPAARPRGRPPTGIVKERMTVNLDPRSLQILETLRYQARKQGRRSATFSELLDEAVALLAQHYDVQLDE